MSASVSVLAAVTVMKVSICGGIFGLQIRIRWRASSYTEFLIVIVIYLFNQKRQSSIQHMTFRKIHCTLRITIRLQLCTYMSEI